MNNMWIVFLFVSCFAVTLPFMFVVFWQFGFGAHFRKFIPPDVAVPMLRRWLLVDLLLVAIVVILAGAMTFTRK